MIVEESIHNQWQNCLEELEARYPDDFNVWIRPLHLEYDVAEGSVRLLAPNQYVLDYVKTHFFCQIDESLKSNRAVKKFEFVVGSRFLHELESPTVIHSGREEAREKSKFEINSYLQEKFNFTNFIKGNSNQLALAAAIQVAENPGENYNPLVIYGGVGLGKTHLMQAIGNHIKENKPRLKVVYVHAEKYVGDMIYALQNNKINDFKQFYRGTNILLVDDIQFLAGKERSQEEFFYTFNSLLEGQHQVILTCDRFPKEVNTIDERLQSRFGWGLTVSIEPPELETRVAILMAKAEKNYPGIEISYEVAFFIAKIVCSNVRELEGALKRVVANARFRGISTITVDFAKESLKDLLAFRDKAITIENIQELVAKFYKIKVKDLLSVRRNRSLTLPRHMAMALAKELTECSLPEIGEAFGRDHTTVMHACKKIKELIQNKTMVADDYKNLVRTLTN